MEHAIWLAIIGAIIALDHAMLGQFMFSQPIVTGALFGWLFNDFQSGIIIGAMLQLLWVGILPVGAFIPSDHTVTGGITACIALMLITKMDMPLNQATILALAVSIPGGYVSGKLDIVVRQFNGKWNDVVENNILTKPNKTINAVAFAGLGLTLGRNLFVYLIWLTGVAWLVTMITPHLPILVEKGLAIAFWLLPSISLAVIIDLIMRERLLWWTVGALGLTLPLALLWPGELFYFMIVIMAIGLVITRWRKTW